MVSLMRNYRRHRVIPGATLRAHPAEAGLECDGAAIRGLQPSGLPGRAMGRAAMAGINLGSQRLSST